MELFENLLTQQTRLRNALLRRLASYFNVQIHDNLEFGSIECFDHDGREIIVVEVRLTAFSDECKSDFSKHVSTQRKFSSEMELQQIVQLPGVKYAPQYTFFLTLVVEGDDFRINRGDENTLGSTIAF